MKAAVLGAGGHARSVAGLVLEELNLPIKAFIDIHSDLKTNELIYGISVIPGKSKLEEVLDSLKIDSLIFAVGDNQIRDQLFTILKKKYQFPNIVSNSAVIKKSAILGTGNVVHCFAYVGPESIIGDNNMINTRATLEHECKVGISNHLAPSCTLLGRATVGNLNFVGAGTIIKPSIHIKNKIIVGANSFVNRDLLDPGTYFGTPTQLKSSS